MTAPLSGGKRRTATSLLSQRLFNRVRRELVELVEWKKNEDRLRDSFGRRIRERKLARAVHGRVELTGHDHVSYVPDFSLRYAETLQLPTVPDIARLKESLGEEKALALIRASFGEYLRRRRLYIDEFAAALDGDAPLLRNATFDELLQLLAVNHSTIAQLSRLGSAVLISPPAEVPHG